jgi:hypothetical protein
LNNIDKSATFWLDGHYFGELTAKGSDEIGWLSTPLVLELAAIKDHVIKDHTIIIDDIRQLNSIDFDYLNKETLLNLIFDINPLYVIELANGYIENDILIAYIPNNNIIINAE